MSQPKITNDQLMGPFFDIANIVRVDKNPKIGTFSSITEAIESVTSATSNNHVTIEVGPGTYDEDPIILKPYMSLKSWAGENDTTIVCNDPDSPVVTGVSNSIIDGFSLTGAIGTTGIGLFFTPTSTESLGMFRAKNIRAIGNTVDVHILGSSSMATHVVCDNLYIITTNNYTTTHIKIENPGSEYLESIFRRTSINNVYNINTILSEAVLITGPNTHATFNNALLHSMAGGPAVGDGIVIQNGAHVDLASTIIHEYNNNLVVRNIGTAPTLHVAAQISGESSIRDVSIEHPGTIGLFTGAANATKVYIHPSSPFTANYSNLDPAGGTITVGPLYFGPNHESVTNYAPLLDESMSTGVLSGGYLSPGTNALDIQVDEGYGYLAIDVGGYFALKYIEWSTQDFTLPDDTNCYLYIDNTGAIQYAVSEPNGITNIIIGRARTLSGVITYISETARRIDHLGSNFDTYLRNAIGAIYESGSQVTENTTPLHLDVTQGTYHYSLLSYYPVGGTDIDMYPWTNVNGVWTKYPSTNTVTNTQYNDTTTGMVNLTSGYYTKHTLYIGGDGPNEQYGFIPGQTEYSSLVLAEQGELPAPPPMFTDNIIPIAAIIVQEGNPNIVQILDIRPRVGFQAASVTANAVHGNLLGLAADDHPQYLLTNGTRTLTGDLNFGTHNITNVGTINGITIINSAPVSAPFITLTNDATLTDERALAVTANQLTLTDGGANSNITLSIATNPILPGNESVTLPIGTTAQQPISPTTGMIRFNSDISTVEQYRSGGWSTVAKIQQILTGNIPSASDVTIIPYDNTIPLISEGTEIWSQAITPLSTSSKIEVQFGITVDSSSSNGIIIVALFRGTTCVTARTWGTGSGNGDRPDSVAIDFTDSPATTSSVTYSVRIGTTAGTWYCNSTSGGTDLGGVLVSSYKLSELL